MLSLFLLLLFKQLKWALKDIFGFMFVLILHLSFDI